MGEFTPSPPLAPKDLAVFRLNGPIIAHLLQGSTKGFFGRDAPSRKRPNLIAHVPLQLVAVLMEESAVVFQRTPP